MVSFKESVDKATTRVMSAGMGVLALEPASTSEAMQKLAETLGPSLVGLLGLLARGVNGGTAGERPPGAGSP